MNQKEDNTSSYENVSLLENIPSIPRGGWIGGGLVSHRAAFVPSPKVILAAPRVRLFVLYS